MSLLIYRFVGFWHDSLIQYLIFLLTTNNEISFCSLPINGSTLTSSPGVRHILQLKLHHLAMAMHAKNNRPSGASYQGDMKRNLKEPVTPP